MFSIGVLFFHHLTHTHTHPFLEFLKRSTNVKTVDLQFIYTYIIYPQRVGKARKKGGRKTDLYI